MAHLKSFLPKANLSDTTTSLIPISFIEIGLLCWWNSCFLISMSSNFISFYPFFIYGFNFFYKFSNF